MAIRAASVGMLMRSLGLSRFSLVYYRCLRGCLRSLLDTIRSRDAHFRWFLGRLVEAPVLGRELAVDVIVLNIGLASVKLDVDY